MTPLIELQHICVDFNQRRVLDNISLTVTKGKITTLIGPNGAGKSTLVNVLLGLQAPTKGKILKEKKIRIGYVPQKLRLNDTLPLSVSRFLSLAGKFSKQEVIEAISLVGSEHLLKSSMHNLSGGETQRILLARALLQRPDVLVLDEPAQGVDVQGQIELYDLINTVRIRFGCAVFMVSHDLHLVMAKTDDVICLQHHICCSGAPTDIRNHPNYLAMFGDKSREILAFYEHHHHHDLAEQPETDAVRDHTCPNHPHGH
ncbi:zinc ABC transporter ATP-binding protein ZnuC [Vibrio salinus]|uniref:zinc ABC transporter ATP-binding protein ZnuC n=1 Tax=Vibrio salinus TaxID=2899784 RepID=UPI001E404D8C|nr:zinc ABC transporter ATP-binding protein ZnuC [Vibrio salinus]MCE0494559.1 zinc ABC transporter ATP-binding protein ZnuC [Vibrio salinus]